MRSLIIFFISTFSLMAFAESNNSFPKIQTEGMQNMMLNMQKIQSCMSNIDQEELMALGQQAKDIQEKIQKECDIGNLKSAQKTAMDFANNLKASKTAEQAQLCLKELPEMMKGHISAIDINALQEKYQNSDICTSINN